MNPLTMMLLAAATAAAQDPEPVLEPLTGASVVCDRCRWTGLDTDLVGDARNCPQCGSTWEVTEVPHVTLRPAGVPVSVTQEMGRLVERSQPEPKPLTEAQICAEAKRERRAAKLRQTWTGRRVGGAP